MSCEPYLCARVHVLNCPQDELDGNCLSIVCPVNISLSLGKQTPPPLPADSYHCVVVINVITIHAILDTSQVALVPTRIALAYASPGPVHFSTATREQEIVLTIEKYPIRQ